MYNGLNDIIIDDSVEPINIRSVKPILKKEHRTSDEKKKKQKKKNDEIKKHDHNCEGCEWERLHVDRESIMGVLPQQNNIFNNVLQPDK